MCSRIKIIVFHFSKVYSIVELGKNGIATPLTVTFDFRNASLDIPKGSFLIATSFCLENDAILFGDLTKQIDARTAIDRIRQHGFHEQYKRMLINPSESTSEMPFDDVIYNLRRFHVIRPIVAKNKQEEMYLSNFLQILTNMGLSPINIDALVAMGNGGLVSCHCPVYLSYAWCKHSCAFAFDRGIITSYPSTMDPKPTQRKKGESGRPCKAKRGGALDKE